jgi:hypothetical protein
MTSVTIAPAVSPRPRRKTAKAAAETISKALDGTEDDSGEEYTPEPIPPSSPKARRHPNSNKRRASSNNCNAGKKSALSPETTEYLKNWMLSPDHIDHPYPTEEEKAQIMRHCGIEMKQLTNWFVNNRKRIWKPKLEELKRRSNDDRKVVPVTGSEDRVTLPDAKRKKTGVLLSPKIAKSHATVKAANKRKGKVLTLPPPPPPPPLVSNPLEMASCSPSVDGDSEDQSVDQVPPLPPPQGAATVTPLVDSMIISNFDQDMIDAAPLLPMASAAASDSHTFDIMPHSCNLVDPLTNKLVSIRYVSCMSCVMFTLTLIGYIFFLVYRADLLNLVPYAQHAAIGTLANSVHGT